RRKSRAITHRLDRQRGHPRVSADAGHFAANLSHEAEVLRKELLEISRRDEAQPPRRTEPTSEPRTERTILDRRPRGERSSALADNRVSRTRNASTSITVPLTITVSLGSSGVPDLHMDETRSGGGRSVDVQEAVTPDEDYDNR